MDVTGSLMKTNSLYERIGVFQGGQTSVLNRWRNERTSCMIDNRPYFSAWQREIIVRRIMTLAGREFDWDEFISKDDPRDPIRDGAKSYMTDGYNGFDPSVPVMPMLPPPMLVE